MDWDTNNINVGLRVAKYGIADKADRKAIIAAYLQGYDQEVAEIVNNIKGYGINSSTNVQYQTNFQTKKAFLSWQR
jgi:hypothetical protein